MVHGLVHIRIVSPSGAIDPAYIDGATQRLRAWGFEVTESPHARGSFGRFSGTDEERLADLVEALSDPSVDYILCSRGGYGLQRIIDRIPIITKPIIGFSDITALHQLSALLPSRSLADPHSTIHGLMCKHVATLPEDSEALQLFRRALQGESLSYSLPPHPLNRFGEATGTLIGGNLSVLYGLQGTPYSLNAVLDAHPEGCILFIEDIGERHYHIDRMMNNLRMSGVLARLKGLIVGQFTDCDPDPLMNPSIVHHTPYTIYDTIAEAIDSYSYPVLFDFPAGHVEYNRPLRLNTPATLKLTETTASLVVSQ